MWKNSGKFSGHTVDFVRRFSLASVCGYLRTSFWSRVFHEMVVFFFNEIVACFVSRIVLQVDATCEFETRTLNKERAAHVLADFSCLYRRTNLVKLEIGMQCDSRFISKIVERSLRLQFHHKYRRDSQIARLITYCLEFCQHRLRFISVYVNKKTSFQLLIKKC